MLCENLPAPHSSHTLEHLPSHSYSVMLWKTETSNVSSFWSSPNWRMQFWILKNGNLEECAPPLGVLKKLHTKQGRTEQAGTLTPHEKLCWGLKSREQPGLNSTAEAKWHKTSGKLSSPKICHKLQPTVKGSRYSSAKEIRFAWKPGNPGRLGGNASSSLLLSVFVHGTVMRAMTAKPSCSCGQCFMKTRNVWSQFQTMGCILNSLTSIWSCRWKSWSLVSRVFLTIKQDLGSIWLPSPILISWEQ